MFEYFKSPLTHVLRIPKLAPLYQRLLRELCKRFRTREETGTVSHRAMGCSPVL